MRKQRPTHPSWPCVAHSERPDLLRRPPFPDADTHPATLSGRDDHFVPAIQRSPFRRLSARESTPAGRVATDFGNNGATAAPCSAHMVLHHLDGFLLPDPARMLHHAADPRVRRVPPPSRGAPRRPLCPSKPSLRPQPPTVTRTLSRSVHQPDLPSRPSPSRVPPSPAAVSDDRGADPRSRGPSGPCSTNGSVADAAVSDLACPVLPWACLIHHLLAPATSEPAR